MNRLFNTRGGSVNRERRLVKPSATVTALAIVEDSSTGVSEANATTDKVYMLVTGFVDKHGIPLGASSVTLAGTYNKTTNEFAAHSTNDTADQVKADGIVLKEGTQIVMTVDAALDSTVLVGAKIDVDTSNPTLLDLASIATATQFRIVKISGNSLGAREIVVEPLLRAI